MNTLVINTYAGSLLLGADAVSGADIIGSFEDVGFGANNTKANRARFRQLNPAFRFVDHRKQWPDIDLSDTVVLAHPPCAAFSQQNTSAAKRGVNTDAFECTRTVLKYAFSNGAAAVAVESVPGALAGAWDVHDHMADAGGYYLYRILKNSILFGVPQFRERFWCVFVRAGLADPIMTWRLSPIVRTIGATLDPIHPGTVVDGLQKTIDKFIKQLTTGPCKCGAVHGFEDAAVRADGLAELHGVKRRGFSLLVQPRFFPDLPPRSVCRLHVSPFTSAQPSILAPGGYAPVLLGSSLWVYRGQPVSQEGYKAIMGFPTDYVFPKDSHYGMRTFLSKGVCPPVATWVLDNIRMHLGHRSGSPFTVPGGYVKTVEPGRIASFKPGRTTVIARLEAMHKLGSPEDDDLLDLRNEEADLES